MEQKTPYEMEIRLRDDFWKYLTAFGWETWCTLGAILGGTSATILQMFIVSTIPVWTLWPVSMVAMFIGCFSAWRKQYHKTLELESTKHATVVLAECVDLIRGGMFPLQALVKSEAWTLPNEAIVEICNSLQVLGHPHPFAEILPLAGEKSKNTLMMIRFGGVDVTDQKSLLRFLDMNQGRKNQ